MSPTSDDKTPSAWLEDKQDVLKWCATQRVVPLPCIWGSKQAIREMWGVNLPGCGSYLNDHPLRRAKIDYIWKTRSHPLQRLNISLVTGWDGICCIDCDSHRTMNIAEGLIDAPIVTSKKGGKFIFSLIGDAPTLVQYKNPEGNVELEFFSRNKHVLIYGKHPDLAETGQPIPYRLYPADIPWLTWDELRALLLRIATSVGLSQGTKREASKKRIEPDIISKSYVSGTTHNISDWFNLPCPQPDNGEQHGDYLKGSHPIHGSTTGSNFSVDHNRGIWHCFRCNSGGDRFMWFLVQHGVISCDQASGGWKGLARDQQRKANDLLKSLYPERYEEYRLQTRKSGYTLKNKGSIEHAVESLPESLPDHQVTLLNGLARTGKSTFGLKCLLDAGQGTYIAHTHSVTENALKLMNNLWIANDVTDKTAVCVAGKEYCCNDQDLKGRCNGCPKAPKSPIDEDKPGISIMALDGIARDLLKNHRILTKDNIPSEFCPYHVLAHAHKYADFVFLVPFYSTVDDELRRVQCRGLTVIDEGPTCDHYRAPCAEIAGCRWTHTQGGQVTIWPETYPNWFVTLKEYIEHRRDDDDDNPPSRKMSTVDTYIISTLDKFLKVYNILIEFNLYPTPLGKKTATEELAAIDFTNTFSKEFKSLVLRRIEEYSKEAGVDSNEMNTLFVIALYPGKTSFSWQGRNPAKLFFVSDNSLYNIPDFKKLLVIGASQGEKFVADYAKERNITDVFKIHLTGFPYPDNYLIVRLAGPNEGKIQKMKEKERDSDIKFLKLQRLQFVKFIRTAHNRTVRATKKYPSLLITSSKEKQEALQKQLRCGTTLVTNHHIKDVWIEVYLAGNMGIYTQNSCISRGIDVPFIDRVFFNPGGFATPAQTAQIQYLQDLIDKAEDDPNIDIDNLKNQISDLSREIAAIQTDEITNNVLRTAPVRSDPTSTTRLKVVVICDSDYEKLDYRIRALTESVLVNDDEDLNLLLSAMDTIHHPVTPTDLNLDRPSPIPLQRINLAEDEPLIPLSEQRNRIRNYGDYRVVSIDRAQVPYEKIINMIVKHPGLSASKRMGKQAVIKYLLAKKGTTVSEQSIKDCIELGLVDRILLNETSDGKTFYKLHPNAIAYVRGEPLKGPDFPDSLKILHQKKM